MSSNDTNITTQIECNFLQNAAFETSYDGELLDIVCPSRDANNIHVNQFDLCDGLFGSLTDNIQKCKYHDANYTFNDCDGKDTLILLHVNVRSLQKNFDSFYEFLEQLQYKPQVTIVSQNPKSPSTSP